MTKIEGELLARKEGYEYFDEHFNGSMSNDKYKHEQYLHTGLWWFRSHKKKIIVFTERISDTDYLYEIFQKDTKALYR